MFCGLHYYADISRLSRRDAAYRDNYFRRVERCRDEPLQKGLTCKKVYGVEDSEPDGYFCSVLDMFTIMIGAWAMP